MAIKKSDLYSSLWASCDELRGGMDASQYKDYVLFMLFIKYITDKYGGSTDFAPPVSIPTGASFRDMHALRGSPDIGDKINTQVIAPLVQANARLARSDFPDFNDPNKLGQGKEMVERLTNLINIFASPQLDFSQNRAEHDDILGDAYEYLMRHFATESGKSKGQFYTPAEVSRVIAKVIGISPENTMASTTAYDPTCGSGSLLLKIAAQAGKHITLEGQEKDVTTAGLARMNMILHDFPTANIVSGNTLAAPKFKDGEQLRTYDYVVANPPFSDKTWTTGLTPSKDPFQRFAWGEPPAKQGDYAYLLHIIRSMKGAGKAACILPHGVLFRGSAEATIREQLVRSGYLKGIIGLPANLFYGTGIPACIVVLDKENAAGRKGVFMIDASKGFTKDGPKNRLREQDIHRIVDVFSKQADAPRYARLVRLDEIADPKNDFNLNLPRYIRSTEPDDLQDIDGHLRGGIPKRDLDALGAYWKVLPSVRAVLFESAGRPGYARLKVPLAEVKPAILGHAEFAAFQQKATEGFADWRKATTPRLTGFDKDDDPKALIETIAEDLLATFRQAQLLDSYGVYQHLLDYWAETMQDDCYLIAADGWVKGARPREIVQVRDKNNKLTWPEPHDYLKGKRRFKSDLVPTTILVARYFAAERDAIEALDNQLATLEQQLDEMREENSGEEGLLAEVIEGDGDKQKIAAKTVKARLKQIGKDPLYGDERAALKAYADLLAQQKEARARRKAAQEDMDKKIDARYPKLTEAETKALVVDDKWMARLSAAMQGELDRVSQTLTSRIRELAERYATPHHRPRRAARDVMRGEGDSAPMTPAFFITQALRVAACQHELRYKFDTYTQHVLERGQTTTQYEDEAKRRFIEEPANMKLLIVVGKLLTGFDAPSCTYIYLDNELHDHNLFQAICRTNRLDGDDKDYGHIVDFKELFGDVQQAMAVYNSDELDADLGNGGDNNVHLKDWLDESKKKLDESRDALRYLCEPVPLPREVEQFLHYFCGDAANPNALTDTEALRVSFYKAVAVSVRAYAAIAQDLTEAGYSDADAAALQKEVDSYCEIRSAIKKHSGEELDIKPYEADMRHLINTYIQADPAADLGELGEMSLTELIIETGIHDAIARKLNEKGNLSDNAIAEGIINNIRKTIVREQLTDPRFYEQMSTLLDDLIRQSRADAAAYEEFLRRAEELVKRLEAKQPDEGVPAALHGKPEATAIYNNLPRILATRHGKAGGVAEDRAAYGDGLVNLALDIDLAMRERAPAGWKGDQAREAQVLNALFPLLDRDREVTLALFELIKNQPGY